MSSHSPLRSSVGPLTVGNVISAALRLYKDHFKPYLGVAFRGTLWSSFPFLILFVLVLIGYLFSQINVIFVLIALIGWLFFSANCMAKYLAHLAIISRLSYQVLRNEPETVKEASEQLIPRKFKFLLVFIITIIPRLLLVEAPSRLSSETVNNFNPIIILIGQFMYWIIYLWVSARFFIPEVPLATETYINAMDSIRRSWELTKGYAWKIAAIIFIATLVTIPIYLFSAIPLLIGFGATAPLWTQDDLTGKAMALVVFMAFFAFLAAILIFLFLNIAAIPFWQSLKAVIYYDLRSRKEGIGLELRE